LSSFLRQQHKEGCAFFKEVLFCHETCHFPENTSGYLALLQPGNLLFKRIKE
jgi:hypothetical protein